MLDARNALLAVKDLQAWYGESHILHGASFDVHEGEVVTLLGRNGAGRTTTLKAILGLVGRRSGSVMINDREAIGLAPHRIARLGIGYCPEERGIFSSLSAEENLLLPPRIAKDGMTLDEVSRRMMVSAGNVTSLVERLVRSGHLERRTAPNDRRSQLMLVISETCNDREELSCIPCSPLSWQPPAAPCKPRPKPSWPPPGVWAIASSKRLRQFWGLLAR